MSKTRAKDLIDLGDRLFTAKQQLDQLNQDIAEQIYPARADFTTTLNLGDEYSQHLDDSFPVLLHRELSDSMSAMLRPKGEAWFRCTTLDEEADAEVENARFLEYIGNTMRRKLYDTRSKFIRATKEGDRDYSAFGMCVISVEEAPRKRDHLHKRFTDAFGTRCDVIGPPEAVAANVLGHDPLAVALLILHIEWMTQRHYVDSVRDDGELDPLFKSLLKHHWMEEAQHAKLDTLMVAALAEGRDEAGIQKALDEYLEIGMFFDEAFKVQAELNVTALETATGTTIDPEVRPALVEQQHQAIRWTYLGTGMTHPKFVATLKALSSKAAERIAEVAPVFA